MTRNPLQKNDATKAVDFPDRLPRAKTKPVAPPVSIRPLAVWLLLCGFGLFGGLGYWATVAPIQSAVVAAGSFEIDGDLQVVEHLEGGIVREILVSEGDDVIKGQVIARLDPARLNAQLAIWRSQLAAALAREARLKGAYLQTDQFEVSDELARMVAETPSFATILATQAELFASDRQSDLGQVAIYDERIAQLKDMLNGIDDRRVTLDEQRTLVRGEVQNLEELFAKGLTVKARLVSRREDDLTLTGRIGDTDSERQTVLQQIAEIEQRKLQVARERRQTIAVEQQALAEQILDIRERVGATQEILGRTEIRAPISGRVVGFELNTIGAVISPGQRLLEIVPADSDFIIEAQVSPADIDEVTLNGPARVRLTAYSYRKTPPITGVVTYIAAKSFFDPSIEKNYYKVNLRIPQQELANLPNVQAIPGMPVQVMIATGEQTILTYLLDPIIGGLETAMVEGE